MQRHGWSLLFHAGLIAQLRKLDASTPTHASSSTLGSTMRTACAQPVPRPTLTWSSIKCSSPGSHPPTGMPCWRPARPTGNR